LCTFVALLMLWPNPALGSAGGHGLVAPAASPTPPTASGGVSTGPSPGPAANTAATKAEGEASEARIVEREELRAQGRIKSTLQAKSGVPPFWIKREYDTHTTRAIAFPPLFYDRKPKEGAPQKLLHMDLSLTFGWYDKRKSKRRWINPAVLFFGAFDEHQSSWAALPLLMGYKRTGDKYNFGAFPLVWAWGNKTTKNLLVAPLHFQSKSEEHFQGVSGLLFWYGRRFTNDRDPGNDRRHFVAFPLYWQMQRGPKTFAASPLYIGGRNRDTGLVHRTFIPIVHWSSHEGGHHTELWSALWIRRKDKIRDRNDWALPPLLAFDSQVRGKRYSSYTPLVWRFGDRRRGSETWAVGPVGWHKDKQQRNHWLAPIYWHFEDSRSQSKAGMFLPLAFWQKNPKQTRVHTLLGYGRGGAQGAGFGIHPLLTYAGRKGDKEHLVALGGLFWGGRNKSEQSSTWGVGPVAYRSKRVGGGAFGIPPLLTFAGKKPELAYQVVTPLFVHVNSKRAGKEHNSFVVGPAYASRRPDGWAAGFAPLYFGQKSKTKNYGVLPLAATWWTANPETGEKSFISPFAVRSTGPGRSTLGVLGLAWDVQRQDAKGKTERHSTLFPLYYRRQKGERSFWVSPLGGGGKHPGGGGWVAGPVYGYKNAQRGKRGYGLAPLFFQTHRDDGGMTTAISGLYMRDRRPQQDIDMWTPLLWRTTVRGDKARKGFMLIPLYFRQRQPGGYDVDAGLGWYWGRNETRRTHTLLAGPFYRHQSRKSVNTGLFPVSWWHDSETRRRMVVLPLIYHQEDKSTGKRTTLAIPLWFDRRLQNGRRTWMAFPFVFGRKGKNDFSRFSVAPPGFFDIHRLRKNTRFTGYVPLLFRYQKCGFQLGDDDACRYTLWGSFPLFMYGKDGLGRKTHSALGLYWFDKDAGGKKLFTLLGGYEYRPDERTRWYGGPLYRDITKTHETTAFFPLYFHKKSRTSSQRLLLVAPPLFLRNKKDDRSWWAAGLVTWQFRTPAKVTTVVLPPVFGHQHAYKERRLTWLAPLFVSDNNFGNDERWFSLPPALYVQHRKGERRQVIQFPFVWHFGSRDRHTTVGVPMWWDVRRPGKRTQVVPGLYFSRLKGGKTTKIYGPLLGWSTKTATSRGWSALFGLFGGGNIDGQRYMHIFGAKIRLKKRGKAKAEEDEASDTDAPSARQLRKAKRTVLRRERKALRRGRQQVRLSPGSARF
jgi:hypothetical protein